MQTVKIQFNQRWTKSAVFAFLMCLLLSNDPAILCIWQNDSCLTWSKFRGCVFLSHSSFLSSSTLWHNRNTFDMAVKSQFYSSFKVYAVQMSNAIWKLVFVSCKPYCVFGHMRIVKAQISLRIRAGWSWPSLSAIRIIVYHRMYDWLESKGPKRLLPMCRKNWIYPFSAYYAAHISY